MPSKKRKPEWQNQYIARTYDRLSILIPKGQKVIVEQAAREANESVNQYTNRALLERMNLSEWPKDEQNEKDA